MTDFLTRLVQRANGQATVIKPMARSSYGALPFINESANGFEETVTFEGGDSPTVANSEVNSSLIQSSVTNPMLERRSVQRPNRQSKRLSDKAKTASTSERSIAGGKTISAKMAAEQRGVAADASSAILQKNLHVHSDSIQRKVDVDTVKAKAIGSRQQSASIRAAGEDRAAMASHNNMIGSETLSNRRAARRQMTTSDATLQRNSHLVDDSRRGSRIATESIQNALEIQELKRVVPQESDLLARGLSRDLVTLEREGSVESSRQKNLGRQQFTAENVIKHTPDSLSVRAAERASLGSENTPSSNIQVTIGRVEIRAVQQPEHQSARPTSAPRRPAVSLDAYLKRRDEERR